MDVFHGLRDDFKRAKARTVIENLPSEHELIRSCLVDQCLQTFFDTRTRADDGA